MVTASLIGFIPSLTFSCVRRVALSGQDWDRCRYKVLFMYSGRQEVGLFLLGQGLSGFMISERLGRRAALVIVLNAPHQE